MVALWHQLHVDMKSLLAWQSFCRDLQLIRSWSLVTVGQPHGPPTGHPGQRGDFLWLRLRAGAQPSCRPQFRTLKPEEQRQALRDLELHYQAFLRDSQDAGSFGPEDRLQAEREYSSCSHHYQQLLQSLEQGRCGGSRGRPGRQGGRGHAGPGKARQGQAARERIVSPGEQEESRCQRCISELKDIRLQLEACETRTVHRLRLPLDKEPARECAQRIAEQQAGAVPSPVPMPSAFSVAGLPCSAHLLLSPQKTQAELEGLGKGVARLSTEAEKVLALPEPSPAAPTLRSELELTLGKLEQVRSLSAFYLEK